MPRWRARSRQRRARRSGSTPPATTAPRPGLRRTGRSRRLWRDREGPPLASRPARSALSSSSHFPLDAIFEQREAGGIAARPRQALDEAGADRVGDGHEYDRHGASRLLQRRNGRGCQLARMTSGASATNSAAYLRMRSASPAPQRYRSARCGHRSSPIRCSPCRNAAMRACPSGSSAAKFMSTPMRRIRSRCCARAASGHAAAAPPSSVMNSRRLMCSLRLRVTPYRTVHRNCVVHHSKFWPPMTGSV